MNDFLVIGGGIAGISAAARLSELGRVLVLEAEAGLAYHASGRSAALYEESYGKPSTLALNRASGAYLASADGGVLSPRGLMVVGGPDEDAAFDDDLKTMSMVEIPVSEALAMVPVLNPETVSRTAIHEGAQDIDTDRLIAHFARVLRTNGGRILTAARVSAITRDASGWQVTAGAETHDAKVLVNAAGAWTDEVAAIAGLAPLGFQPHRRSIARVAAPEGVDLRGWPMLFGPGETWYAKPDAGALIVSPADEDPVDPHDAWADDMTLAEGIARYEARVTAPVTRMIANWAGLRTFSPDRQLVIGYAPGRDDYLWMAGQGGYGFQTSPAASLLLADIAGGRDSELDPEIVAALSPARFG